MADDVLSNWAANTALQLILPPGTHLGLHLTDPTPVGNVGSEVAGGGYLRQLINFADPANRSRVSINAQLFAGMPACTVRWLAVWTAVSGGYLVFSKKLAVQIPVLESGQFLVAAGDIALSL